MFKKNLFQSRKWLKFKKNLFQSSKWLNVQEKLILVKKMVKCLGKAYSSQVNGYWSRKAKQVKKVSNSKETG